MVSHVQLQNVLCQNMERIQKMGQNYTIMI